MAQTAPPAETAAMLSRRRSNWLARTGAVSPDLRAALRTCHPSAAPVRAAAERR